MLPLSSGMLDPASDDGRCCTHSIVSSHASHMTCWGKLMTSLWNHFPASHPCDMHSPPHPWSRKSSSKSRQAGFALQAEARGETLQKAEVGSRKQQWVDSCSAADKPNVCLTQANPCNHLAVFPSRCQTMFITRVRGSSCMAVYNACLAGVSWS